MEKPDIASEMRLFSPEGDRLYLTGAERDKFLEAANHASPVHRMLCHVIHFTGCRPTEATELDYSRIHVDEKEIIFRCLKKLKHDKRGREKQEQYRSVPVPKELIEHLDLVFGIRGVQKRGGNLDKRFWPISRTAAYRIVKNVMNNAGIKGKQATSKGLRHGFGVAMVTAKKPLPVHVLSRLMGHSTSKVTEIYLQVTGDEQRQLVTDAWESEGN